MSKKDHDALKAATKDKLVDVKKYSEIMKNKKPIKYLLSYIKDANGNERELHVEKAVAVTTYEEQKVDTTKIE